MNINFLNYDEHTLTEDYLNMIYTKNFLPLIIKATRITHHIAALIDYIYTNALHMNISSRIIAAESDVSDHLPIFCMAEIQIDKIKQKFYFRDNNNFHLEAYINDVTSFNWNNIISSSEFNLNEKTVKIIDSFKAIIDNHSSLKLASKSEAKQLSKPRLTNKMVC